MQLPDLSSLTAIQFLGVLLAVALVDFATGIYGAINAPMNSGQAFDPMKVLTILETHGLNRIIPIGALFAIGAIASVGALCYLADGLLATYVAETVLSSAGNLVKPPAAA